MARFKLFPRSRRPGLGELLGISQAERQVSPKYHLRMVCDPMSPLENAETGARPRAGFYRGPMTLVQIDQDKRVAEWIEHHGNAANRSVDQCSGHRGKRRRTQRSAGTPGKR